MISFYSSADGSMFLLLCLLMFEEVMLVHTSEFLRACQCSVLLV